MVKTTELRQGNIIRFKTKSIRWNGNAFCCVCGLGVDSISFWDIKNDEVLIIKQVIKNKVPRKLAKAGFDDFPDIIKFEPWVGLEKQFSKIKVTKSWLLKLGWVEKSDKTYWIGTKNGSAEFITKRSDGFYYELGKDRIVYLDSVHHLQNMFYDITKKELSLKSKIEVYGVK